MTEYTLIYPALVVATLAGAVFGENFASTTLARGWRTVVCTVAGGLVGLALAGLLPLAVLIDWGLL